MGNKWTDEQLAAITTSGCDLLVAAGAGSGKTAVLVERIIRKVVEEKNPIDLDRLLVVTFTNAAASEMRERIGDAITRELDKNPESLALQRQLALLPKASITTIHSFCLEVIRNNFHIINIDPNFRIADETETILLKQEIGEELFDRKYDIEELGFLELVETYGTGRNDDRLLELVLELHRFAESSPWPAQWLTEAAENFHVDQGFQIEDTLWAKYLLKSIGIEINGLVANMKRAIRCIDENEELEPYREAYATELCALLALEKQSWSAFIQGVLDISFGRLKPVKGVDPDLKKGITDLRDKVKKRVKLAQDSLSKLDNESIREQLASLYPRMKALSELVIEFKELYGTKKREKGMIDFNDIEHYALDILTAKDQNGEMLFDADGHNLPSEVALLYREKFTEVLVDEYQDSNMVQEVMLSMVSRREAGSKNLFMVGDVKQSIYRFRQAMPELFLSKYNTFSEDDQGDHRKITLFRNFRSRENVIDGVNFIFKQIMSENIGELDYDETESLNPGAKFLEIEDAGVIGGAIELHLVDTELMEKEDASDKLEQEMALGSELPIGEDGEGNEDGSQEEDLGSIELEARVAIKRIKEMINGRDEQEFKVFDKRRNAYRRVEYRDIVILLRATRNWSNILLEQFSREGIPAFADTGTGYFETIEIKTILALLQIIDNPMQDIPLLAVLRSPMFNFTPKELIDIHLENKGDSFYDALKKLGETDISGLSVKCIDFLNKLDDWRKRSVHTPIDELLWDLYSETGYLSYVGAMPGGVQRQANLKVLFERARQFETTSYKGLFNFMNFMNKLKRSSGDMGSAKILGENENVVRIMSIHKSKGLEFPVVFVAGAGKGFNMMDLTRSILFHKELGFGPDYVDFERRYTYSSMVKEAIKTRTRLETLSEEMRVLYVAFTRAREKLIITGAVKNVEKHAAKWVQNAELVNGKLSELEILMSRTYLDWICPSVVNHPDGKALVALAGGEAIAEPGHRSWDLFFWNREKLLSDKREEVDVEQTLLPVDSEALDQRLSLEEEREQTLQHRQELVEQRLGYEYPYRLASKIPAKLSVSELKKARMQELMYDDGNDDATQLFAETETAMRKPRFLQEKKGFDAAEKGTLMHYAMQQLQVSNVDTLVQIKEQLEWMKACDMLTEEEAAVISPKKLLTYFQSPLGIRMKKAESIMREVPFSIELPATSVYSELDVAVYAGEMLMLQGVIDCCFVENDEFILLDYKTDYVEDGKTDQIKDRYQLQLDCYAAALEKITGRRVDRKYLYLFSCNEVVECP